MAEENLRTLRRAYDLVNERDLDGVLALVAEDLVGEPRTSAFEGGYRGREGLKRWWNDTFTAFPDVEVELSDMRDLGDTVLAAIRVRARAAQSNTPIDDHVWQAARFRDGKVVWLRTFSTEAEAMEAATSR